MLKVDFSKVFDMVDWDFLLELLEAQRFGTQCVSWIKTILYSSKATILVNDSQCGYVRY